MTLGTGIFLSSLFLGLCYLFIQTKDRWNWKKICFWSLGFPLLLGFVVAVYLWVVNYIEDLPKEIVEIKGIHLGDSKSDLLFKYKLSKEDAPKNTLIFNNHVQVIFDKNSKAKGLVYTCMNEGYWTDRTNINGIACYDSGDDIIEGFGKEQVDVLCVNNDGKTEGSRFGGVPLTQKEEEELAILEELERRSLKPPKGFVLEKPWDRYAQRERRYYLTNKYNVGYILTKNKVEGFLIKPSTFKI